MRRNAHLILLLLATPPALAAVVDANPTNYRSRLSTLQPGDTLVLASGTYADGLPLDGKNGTAQQPIIIRGPDDQSAIFTARSCCNTVQLDNTSYVEVRNLTLDGLNLDGPFGVDGRNVTHHITIENLKIINFGADQQDVGISTKGPAWNWIIRRNTIVGAGTGIYLGNSDGTQPFVAGLIENNLIVDTIGYNLQIKHQAPRPTNVGLPTGTSRTIIRNNVFSKRNNASTGSLARPNLLVGHFPLSGAGMDDVYEIYGNFFYENPTEALFQGEGNIALLDNLFVNSSGDAVNIVPQNDKPRAVTVLHNTVVASGAGIRVSGGAAGTLQRIVGNASFAATPVSGPNATDNVTGTRAEAANFLVAPLAALGSLNLYPKAGALSGTTIDLTPFNAFTDYNLDFNGQARAGRYRGAYEGEGSNPGWTLAMALKPTAAAPSNPAPTISLTANPIQVTLQGSSTLTWSTTNATSCTASGGWTGARVTSGSTSVGPIGAATSYRLDCTGPGGSASATATVTTFAAPTVTLTASAARVTSGGTVTLQWSSTNATACTASGSWSGSRATSGSEATAALTAAATYSLACSGNGGSATQSVSVAVDPVSTGATTPGTTSTGGTTTPATTTSTSSAASSGSGGGGATSPWLLLLLGASVLGKSAGLRGTRLFGAAIR